MNSLRESTNNGREIEDMIGRISFSGDDLSAPSDQEIAEEQEEEQEGLGEEDADNESSSNEYINEGRRKKYLLTEIGLDQEDWETPHNFGLPQKELYEKLNQLYVINPNTNNSSKEFVRHLANFRTLINCSRTSTLRALIQASTTARGIP